MKIIKIEKCRNKRASEITFIFKRNREPKKNIRSRQYWKRSDQIGSGIIFSLEKYFIIHENFGIRENIKILKNFENNILELYLFIKLKKQCQNFQKFQQS